MQEGKQDSKQSLNPIPTSDEKTVIDTDAGNKTGQDKCPKCGATDISLNVATGKLRCNFCRHEFDPQAVIGIEQDVSKLQGQVMGSGASDISADAEDMVTLKCSSCGAEVVVDTTSSTQARCHWCRNTLSINEQIPNGAVPDMVLPFKLAKEEAQTSIQTFVKKRNFFVNPTFKKEFTTENIMGVYFPYMVVDTNAHVKLVGEGEHLVKMYTRGSGDDKETYYDADAYAVEREFDIAVNDLTVESSSERLNNTSKEKTNNVINAIMPFDIENCVKFNSNYLKGYTSEKRDTNIDALRPHVEAQTKDIARFAVNNTLEEYDRGVCWSSEDLDIKGQQWVTAYLPVWLYSYQQVKGKKKVLHYVAVNARTKETMGSVPINMPKLLFISFLVELLGFFAMIAIEFDENWIFLSVGIVFYIIMFARYRNSNARHFHELETENKVSNLRKGDRYIGRRTGLKNAKIRGANNTSVSTESQGAAFINAVSKQAKTIELFKGKLDD